MNISRRAILGAPALLLGAAQAKRPNILWIVAEDMSATLGCYGDPVARTPHLDRFAKESVRFTHAFASAPVCSAARSCLITGNYPTRTGMLHHRSRVTLPEEVRGFPAYLREAGYYTTNNAKTDYNLADERSFVRDCWDESSGRSHWRNRPAGVPFFAVFNSALTHQSRISQWPWEQFENEVAKHLKPEERTDPAAVKVPPYFPDTPVVRKTLAREYDCGQVMDRLHAAHYLRQLEEDGLAEDTIVFFYSDHGSGLPRGKRTLYDSGMHVPLLVRFPEKYQHLAPSGPGTTCDTLVSFIDFPRTVLNLAGVRPGHEMEAKVFAGPDRTTRRYIGGARDRIDEAFDLSRCLRDQRWLYVRNFHPHLGWHQPENYSRDEELRLEISRLAEAGKLNAAQMAYAGGDRPVEELYDTLADPHQIRNLAGDPQHAATLETMRDDLWARWMRGHEDIGVFAEGQLIEETGNRPRSTGFNRKRQAACFTAVDRIGRPGALADAAKALKDADPHVRIWSAMALHAAGPAAARYREALTAALDDAAPEARIEAAVALVKIDGELAGKPLAALIEALGSGNPIVIARASRTLELLGEKSRLALAALQRTLATVEETRKDNMGYDYAVRATLRSAVANLTG